MKDIKTQTRIERAVKVPSGIKGFEDREFVIVITSHGIGLRKKGETDMYNFQTWNEWIRWMYAHPRTRPMPKEVA